MPLSAGTRLGPYEILAPIGAGGMGEVYRAHDPRMGRDVAIKISAERFNERFFREVHAVAALNHPNICHIYDVGPNYLVMELVEGPTLAERIKAGAAPLEEVLPVARQIADALEAAHEKGIIHRDLKPANIKIKPDGMVKVLDFGLAKIVEHTTPADPEISPTRTMEATRAGQILGTAAYMAPEQARGLHVDRRADIWAFGVVLYEMLAGRRAFSGETITDVLAAVMRAEPDWDALPTTTPHPVLNLLKRCLQKDGKQRLQSIGEARIAIDDYLANPAGALPEPTQKVSRWSLRLWAAAAIVATVAAVFAWYWRPEPRNELSRFLVPSPTDTAFTIDAPAITLDGRTLAFVSGSGGKTQLWIRPLDSSLPHPLEGTEGARAPFWSPDGRWIGFFADDGKLKKVRVSGGSAQTLCDAAVGRGGTWGRDGTVVFAPSVSTGLFRVPDTGGAAVPVTALDASRRENSHRWPYFLPDGRHFLYFTRSYDAENSGVFLGSLNSNETTRLWKVESNAIYGAASTGKSGYLLAVQEGTLVARPFDAHQRRFTAEAFPIAERVGRVTPASAALFSVSNNGVLIYGVGGLGDAVQLTWCDRSGKQLATLGSPGLYGSLSLAPDGKRLAVNWLDPLGVSDIYLFELSRGVASRLTFGPPVNVLPVWSPDGSRIVFASSRDGPENLYWKASSVNAAEEPLLKSEVRKFPTDWSPDGRYILFTIVDPKAKSSLWVLPLSEDRRPFRLSETSFSEDYGRFSPDGKFLAYSSDESGRWDVYVESFRPDTQAHKSAGKWRVSIRGGSQPHWRHDGKELFYLDDDNRIMAVPIKIGARFDAGIPRQLFDARLSREYDVQADGRRFLLPVPAMEKSSEPFTVVINWTAGLNR